MSQLVYKVTNTAYSWITSCIINYTATYDPVTNKTTIVFSECDQSYWGIKGYGTRADTTITVEAADNPHSTATATFNTSGVTTGAVAPFKGTPTPATITVTHTTASGEKQIVISGSSKFYVYMSTDTSSQQTATGTGSQTTTSGVRGQARTLTVNAEETTVVTVNRTSSPYGNGDIGNVSSGETIYDGDELQITFTAATGYDLTTHTVNGEAFTSGETHTVDADVIIIAAAIPKSFSLSISIGAHSIVDVTRTSSNASASIGTITDGETIYYGDVLMIVFGAASGYELKTATVNGNTFTSGNSHTVTSNVTIVTIAASSGVVYIDNGTTIEKYQVYVDNGSSWDRYIPYVDDGTDWNMCG